MVNVTGFTWFIAAPSLSPAPRRGLAEQQVADPAQDAAVTGTQISWYQ